jgi:hypothetical protein
MTLSERNNVFKAGICIASGGLVFMVITAFVIIPAYPPVLGETTRRSAGIIQGLAAFFLKPSPYVPLVSMISAVLYAFIAIIVIYYYFEKTQSPEILYIGFFVLSFALEASRIMIPLKIRYELPSVYLIMASRVLLFGRYFGIFSLFVASVYAANLKVQSQRSSIFIIALITLMTALGIPIDGLSWDSSLCMIRGYSTMFSIVEVGVVLISLVSFFISAYTRGIKEYAFIGIGSFLVILGRNMLFSADTWITPFPGALLLALGTWSICTQLHKIYLWF